MSNRLRVVLAALAAALVCVPAAGAARGMLVGLLDEAALYDDPAYVFPLMQQARTQVLRVNLYWGGRAGVAKRRPARATDPADPAYDWSLYDRTVNYAAQHRMRVLFSIYGTPGWANGGAGLNVPPRAIADLRNFAFAAARRYSGVYPGAGRPDPAGGQALARLERAEPDARAQAAVPPRRRRAGSIQSAVDYAKICTAVYDGVTRTLIAGERVACGATAPRGNNQPTSARPTVSPLAFMRALKAAGLSARKFDAYAHHPYYGRAHGGALDAPLADGGDDGEHQRADRGAHAPVGPQAALDHRVRLPDEPARPRLRRHLREAGGVHARGVHDGAEEPAHRHDALVPAPRRAEPRRLAVGAPDAARAEEAGVQRLPRLPREADSPASSAPSAAAPTTSVTTVRSADQTSASSIGITEIQ